MQWEWTQSFARTRGRLRALDTKLLNSRAASTPPNGKLLTGPWPQRHIVAAKLIHFLAG